MKPVAVESTTFVTMAYDLDRQLLQLEFRDRATYCYFDVPAEVYQGLVAASSKGSYFNRSIRGRFLHARAATTSSLS
jgi:hypothetical protein